MKVHELKTWPEFYVPILRGEKTFEIRLDDRGFRVGDQLLLREWLPIKKEYTGRELLVNINYIVQGFSGLSQGWVAMSIEIPSSGLTPAPADGAKCAAPDCENPGIYQIWLCGDHGNPAPPLSQTVGRLVARKVEI